MRFRRSQQFATIYLDPPWPEYGGTAKSKKFGAGKRGADRHYPLLTVKKMPGVIRGSGMFRPAADAHMYMWSTNTYLMKAGQLMEELGFRYVTCIPWVKTQKRAGLGQYFRGKSEQLLFGVRGDGYKVRTDDKYVVGLIAAPTTGHSVKPLVAYDLIEKRSCGPYVELFARDNAQRPGWQFWGDDANGGQIDLTSKGCQPCSHD